MRKQYSAAFKARVVQEPLKEEKTLAHIASEYEVHPTQLKKWRAVALEGLPSIFEKQDSTIELKRAHEQQRDKLAGQVAYRPAVLLAERFGTQVVNFPGDHGGYGAQPAAFAAKLRDVLG
jgi:transposase